MRLLGISILLVTLSLAKKKCRKYASQDEDDPSNNVPQVIKSPLPYTYLLESELPRHFDWRSVNGTNFVTVDLNQHVPVYCGSCWLHGSISSLNDRLKIARKAQFPEINLARQVVLNCGNSTAGSCDGGGDYGLYVFVHKFGLPDDTCQLYSAQEHACSGMFVNELYIYSLAFRNCMNCETSSDTPAGVCFPVQSYTRYFVSEYGKMPNPTIHQMKAEIFKRGPISCSIDANYITNGQYLPGDIVTVTSPKNETAEWDLDHVVSVAGWGVDEQSGMEYWIVRNSWGTFWLSDRGWFKVLLGVNAIGIESDCNWAVVDPQGVRNDWGPSDIYREFPSSSITPKPGQEEQNAEFFGFVEDPFEVIPTLPPSSEVSTDTNTTRLQLPELKGSEPL